MLEEFQKKLDLITVDKNSVAKEIQKKWIPLAKTEAEKLVEAAKLSEKAQSIDLTNMCSGPLRGYENLEICHAWLDQKLWDEATAKYHKVDMPTWKKQVKVAAASAIGIDAKLEQWSKRMTLYEAQDDGFEEATVEQTCIFGSTEKIPGWSSSLAPKDHSTPYTSIPTWKAGHAPSSKNETFCEQLQAECTVK